MKCLLLVLILLLSGCAITDNKTSIHVGYGIPYKADYGGSQVKSISIERNQIKVEYSRWDTYTRTPWIKAIKKYPQLPLIEIESHNVLAVTTKIFEYKFKKDSFFGLLNDCNLFFDMGISYTTKISVTTSYPISFHEKLGLQCGGFRAQFVHDSNAGLVPPNTGADYFGISYLLWSSD